jgi:hypothetical protein
MIRQKFDNEITKVTDAIAGRPLDSALENHLNTLFAPDGEAFNRLQSLCEAGVKDGWMCAHGEDGRKFGRVIKPGPDSHDLSVDVVLLDDVTGPHHRHPNGEICAVMPLTGAAQFDGHGKGWCVYPPGSAHWPTVRGGKALVLYLLPGGKIDFTGK